MELSYRKTDAFIAGDSLGNPAACLYLKADQMLGDAQMLDIARRHRGFVSELVACRPEPDGGYALSYWSSECEVDFCGHGTIACLYSLIHSTPELYRRPEIRITTRRKGPLTVYNRIPSQDAVYISAPEPRHIGTELSRTAIAEALGTAADAISGGTPPDCVDAGLVTLLVPFDRLEDLIRLQPDERTLGDFCLAHDIGIVLAYAMQAERPDHFAHTRVFAPRFGYLEDPATGSGNSAFGAYLRKNGRWDGRDIAIEQGGAGIVYNTVRLAAEGDRILFGGRAVDRIRGVWLL
ncbi:MAG: PhzF family phenazine biosynthesis protein [Clostridia bacterium]|nr:PhzF family phenazine biosynthesis protein [Clostridia bacterium]